MTVAKLSRNNIVRYQILIMESHLSYLTPWQLRLDRCEAFVYFKQNG